MLNLKIFTSDRSLLKQFGVNDITQIDKFLKMGTLDNSTIYAIPHFSAQGYSNDDRNIMGEQLSKVLV